MSWGQLAESVTQPPNTHASNPKRNLSLVQVMDQHVAQQETPDSAALALPALYATVRLIASSIDQLPLVAENGTLPRWIEQPRRVGSHFDLGDLIMGAVTEMAVFGAAYLCVTHTSAGWRLEPIPTSQITVRRSTGGPLRLTYYMDGHPIERFPYWDAEREHTQYLLPIPYLVTTAHPEGVSPLQAARVAVAGYATVEHKSAGLLTGGTHVGGRLETDAEITENYAKRLQKLWLDARANNVIPVLGGGFRYVEPKVNLSELQMLESRSFNSMQIAACYGVPPSYLGMSLMGGNSSLSYANASDNARLFRTNCLAHFTRQIEDALSELMPNGRYAAEAQRVRFDWTEWERAGNADNDAARVADPDGSGE